MENPIVSKKKLEKIDRNRKIIAEYLKLISIPGSQRYATAEKVGEILGYNYSLVLRVTKDLKIN